MVYGCSNFLGNNQKCFIVCVNENVSIIESDKDVYLYVKERFVLISNKIHIKSKAFATISIMEKAISNPKILSNNNYFICDKKGVTRCQNGEMYRKFRKYCYFILNFHKKML